MRRLAIATAALAVIGAGTADAARRQDEPAGRLGARYPHAVVGKPPPSGRRAVPGGGVQVSPTAILAGDPTQRIEVSLTLQRAVREGRFAVRLPRRWSRPAGNAPHVRAVRLEGGTPATAHLRRAGGLQTVVLERAQAGDRLTVALEGLNPPAGTWSLDLLWADRGEKAKVADRAEVVVYGRTRLPTLRGGRGGPLASSSGSTRAVETYDSTSDPAVAADPFGSLWYSFLVFNSGDGNNRVVVNRLPAGGSSFQTLNTGLPRRDGSDFQDKNMITIDTAAGSPHQGRLYVVWNENQPSGAQNTVISMCDTVPNGPAHCDDPNNWTVPAQVTDAGGSYISADVAAAPNGDVYVVWWDYADNRIEGDKCAAASDCASSASWGTDQTVDSLNSNGGPIPFFCPIVAAPGGRVGPLPSIEVSQFAANSGTVFVATSDIRSSPGTSRCSESANDRRWDTFVADAANALPSIDSAGTSLSGNLAGDNFLPWLDVNQSDGTAETAFYKTDPDASRQEAIYSRVPVSTTGTPGSLEEVAANPSDYSEPFSSGFDYGDYNGIAAGSVYPVWTDGSDLSSLGEVHFKKLGSSELNLTSGSAEGAETSIDFTGSGPTRRILVGANNLIGAPMLAFLSTNDGSSFSSLPVPIDANAPGAPSPPPGPGATPTPTTTPTATPLDTTAPTLTLSARRVLRGLRRRSVSFTALCNENCRFVASSTLSVPAAARVFRMRRVSRSLVAGRRTRITLRFPRRSLRPLRRALLATRTATVTIRGSATDAAGNRSRRTKRIRLRR